MKMVGELLFKLILDNTPKRENLSGIRTAIGRASGETYLNKHRRSKIV